MKSVISAALIGFIPLYWLSIPAFEGYQDGDIIFHTSQSAQSRMVRVVTGSSLTHCGIIFIKNGKPMVYEAVNPVKITSLDNWINRGQNKSYRVLRYRTKLSSEQIQAIKSYSQKQLGKSYDLKFQWSDGKMYCSELVWKAYKAAGIELCKPNKFSDYNINSPLARQAIRQRYGKSINLDEPVVAPSDIFNSWSLRVVKSN